MLFRSRTLWPELTPRFNNIRLTYLNTSIDFHVSQVFKFINRSEDPLLAPFCRVDVEFNPGRIKLKVYHKRHYIFDGRDWQVWDIVQFFNQFSATLSNVRDRLGAISLPIHHFADAVFTWEHSTLRCPCT